MPAEGSTACTAKPRAATTEASAPVPQPMSRIRAPGREAEYVAVRAEHAPERRPLRVEEEVVGEGHEVERPRVSACPHHSACFFSILAQVSFRLTDRLNTGRPGAESGSTMK